jgi:hypothetical protein
MLIRAGADVDAKARYVDGKSRTALITAIEHTCCCQPLKILLGHGADPAQRVVQNLDTTAQSSKSWCGYTLQSAAICWVLALGASEGQ